jgi:hypothetical protein
MGLGKRCLGLQDSGSAGFKIVVALEHLADQLGCCRITKSLPPRLGVTKVVDIGDVLGSVEITVVRIRRCLGSLIFRPDHTAR